jgi:hypothetical protein
MLHSPIAISRTVFRQNQLLANKFRPRSQPVVTLSKQQVSNMAGTMRAAVIHEAGGPEVFKLEDVPTPTPKDNEVLIRTKAFGLNRSEMCM